MNTMKRTLPALLVLALLGACEKQPPLPEKSEAKTPAKQAEPAVPAETPEKDVVPAETPEKDVVEAAPIDAKAVEAKGIAWLRAQAKDGVWMAPGRDGPAPSAAFTALAVTPIARALPEGQRANDPLVKQAQAFLLSCLAEDGAVRQGPASKYDNYFTSTALMALETIDDPAQADARKKMRDFILTLQRQEEGRIQGGIGYNTQQSADLSNSQFAIEALRAAGVPEDDPAMQQALKYLERVQNRSENEENKGAIYELEDPDEGKVKVVPGNDGSAGYEPGVSKAGLHRLPDGTFVPRGYGSMTYALLKCYILVGLAPDDARVQGALEWLGENYTWDKNPGFDVVAKLREEAPYWGLYYYYMTAAKALRLVGIDEVETSDGPRDWRADLRAAIAKRQRDDGSWKNDQSPRWEEGDPIITTAYALIALQEIEGAK